METLAERSPGPAHVAQIDALRGIASLLVSLFFHIHYVIGSYRTGPLDGLPFFTWLHDYGYTMVDLFFLVSGYIFSHVYLAEGRLQQGVGFRSFMVARIARLYPLHLVTLCVTAIILCFGLPPTWTGVLADPYHFLLNLLFLQESGLNAGYSFNYPSWSLSVEMFCYVAFILAALRGPKVLRAAAFGMVTVAPVLATLDLPMLVHVARGFFGFFAGHLLWSHRAKFDGISTLRLSLLAGLAFMLPPPPLLNAGIYYAATLWPLLLVLSLRSTALSGPLFRWLGDRSYSIYMIHAPVFAALSLFWLDGLPVPRSAWPLACTVSAVCVLGLAHLSYRFLEEPARRRIRAWGERRLVSAPTGAAAEAA